MLRVSILTALAASAACAYGGNERRVSASIPTLANQTATSDAIVVGEQSNVCVSVQVDQAIWPRPLTAETNSSLSGILASELRRLFEEGGVSAFIPNPRARSGPRPEPRFVANYNGTNPICHDTGEDIYVSAVYSPRPEGGAFVFNYRIEQGAIIRSGSFSRNILDELRTGRIRTSHINEPLQLAVADDLRARATIMFNEIYFTIGK